MNLPEWLKKPGRQFRAILFPIGEIRHHMEILVRKSAKEIDMQPEVIQRMAALAEETCLETGLSSITEEDA